MISRLNKIIYHITRPFSSYTSLRRAPKFESNSNVVPKAVTLQKDHKYLHIEYSDGRKLSYPSEYLRVYSPSAQSEKLGRVNGALGSGIVSGRKFVNISSIETVGSYALRLHFDDLHNSGIFSWELLRHLGDEKLPLMRGYILEIRRRGLSRWPRTKK
mmetsp:Transcript_10660/g.19469  ORF Transcript_10660/g.19469 Transcript_10660/m.19469 type:complete len:158 (+) Transcript_10660:27-500(+)